MKITELQSGCLQIKPEKVYSPKNITVYWAATKFQAFMLGTLLLPLLIVLGNRYQNLCCRDKKTETRKPVLNDRSWQGTGRNSPRLPAWCPRRNSQSSNYLITTVNIANTSWLELWSVTHCKIRQQNIKFDSRHRSHCADKKYKLNWRLKRIM